MTPRRALICVPGWASGPSVWEPTARLLGEDWTLVHVSWLDCIRDDGAALHQAIKDAPSPPVVVAWSLGAIAVLGAGLSSLGVPMVLVSGMARLTEAPGYPGVPARALDAMIARLTRNPSRVLNDFSWNAFLDAREAAEAFVKQGFTFDTAALVAGLEYLRDADHREALGRFQGRVLLLHGECDAIAPPLLATWLAERTGAPLTLLPGGHALPHSHPESVADAIRSLAG